MKEKNSLHDRNNWTSRSWKNDFNRCNQKNSYNKRKREIKKIDGIMSQTLTTREERNISLTSSIEYGAILVVSAIDGIMSQTAEQIMIAHHMGMQHIVVFMNKCDMVDDMEMLELVEMGIRDQLYQCGFVGSDIPFIYGAALKALEGPDGEWGDKIMELMDAVDKYIPDSQSEIDQASSIHTKFTAEVYMLDINEGGRDTGYFDDDRLQFYGGAGDGPSYLFSL